MPTIAEALDIALNFHQAGQLDRAEAIYRQILQVEPENADALHLLGVLVHQTGRHAPAADFIARAIAINPNDGAYHNNLGMVYQALSESARAEACYRKALELRPGDAEIYNNLGNALKSQDNRHEARQCYEQAIALRPDFAPAHSNLGMMLSAEGRRDEAVTCLRRALQLRPDFAAAYSNLGGVLTDKGDYTEAAECFARALQLAPQMAEAHGNFANLLTALGRTDEAIARYRQAIQLKPNYMAAIISLATLLAERGALDEAAVWCRRVIELEPNSPEAHCRLGMVLRADGKLDAAAGAYQRALELDPDYPDAHLNRGNVLKAQGRLDDAAAEYQQALALREDYAFAHSNLVFCAQFRTGATPAGLFALHAEWDRRHAAPLAVQWKPHANVRDPERTIRLGFVSADFWRHPVTYFLLRAVEALRGAQCETVFYSDRTKEDDLTARLRSAAHLWRDARRLGDAELAEQVRTDGVDILFDLAGHTAGSRLQMFARKPAPIQITWIGYEGTTGLAAMDYIIADRFVIPAGTEEHYREKVLRMPDGYVCYDPPTDCPEVGPLPAARTGQVTFGSFNNPAKITPEVVAVWAEIMWRVPGSRLVLKYIGLDSPCTSQRYRELFASCGIDPRRLELLGYTTYDPMLAEYNRIDLGLDPFPFSGSATTLEALWMGVPVITCPHETFASRHSLSHLSNVGLTDLVAHDLAQYMELAVALAGDWPRLAALRAGLRRQVAESPLCDGRRFAEHLMKLLRDCWREWVRG